jgi:hypothetical protein
MKKQYLKLKPLKKLGKGVLPRRKCGVLKPKTKLKI